MTLSSGDVNAIKTGNKNPACISPQQEAYCNQTREIK